MMNKEKYNQKQFLEEEIGGTWIGIQFNSLPSNGVECTKDEMRICMAIRHAEKETFILPVQKIDCMGGRRSVGCLPNEEELVNHVSAATGLAIPAVQTVIQKTPYLTDIQSLEFGNIDHPKVWISYCTPRIAMKLVRFWQTKYPDDIHFEISTFLATCGHVMAKAFLTQRICISLGCPTSRELGYINENELVVGVPGRLLRSIIGE